MTGPALIVFSGLPGVGKTTIARELAWQIRAVHVRIDSIEQAIRDSVLRVQAVEDAGYRVGYAIAADNLRLGHTVIADSVNPLPITRDAWRAVGTQAKVSVVEIEIVCSNRQEHQRRLESRVDEVAGLKRITWQEVVNRDYHAWDRDRCVIDTATATVDEAVRAMRARLERPLRSSY